jgi:hypothetical protein
MVRHNSNKPENIVFEFLLALTLNCWIREHRLNGEGVWNEIEFDALGRVREKFMAGQVSYTKKFYSDGRQLIQQLEDGNNAEFDYLRGPTGLDRQWNEATDKRYFYIKDPLGTVWAMIESGFTPQQSPLIRLYNYNAWGEHIDASDINFPDYTSDPNLMRYIGCRVEAFGKGTTTQGDAIYQLDKKHYLPVIVNFVQKDPLHLMRRMRNSGRPPKVMQRPEPIPPYTPCWGLQEPPEPEPPETGFPVTPPTQQPSPPSFGCWCPCWIEYDLLNMFNGPFCRSFFSFYPQSAFDSFLDINRFRYSVLWDRNYVCCLDETGAVEAIVRAWREILGSALDQFFDLVPPLERIFFLELYKVLLQCLYEALCDLCLFLQGSCKALCPQNVVPEDVCAEFCEESISLFEAFARIIQTGTGELSQRVTPPYIRRS